MMQLRPGDVTHGMSDTPEYRIWCHIKERCLDENSEAFAKYGAKGVTMEPAWQSDFEKFFAEIGKRPSDGMSVERIDNSKGYVAGNVRWATATEQARNRFKRQDNKTGVTGVHLEVVCGRPLYRATWYDTVTMKQVRKNFSVAKYGLLPAFAMAAKARAEALQTLKEAHGYSESHGTERKVK